MSRAGATVWATMVAAGWLWLAAAAADDALDFVRVNLPAGGLPDVPIGDGRYLPMPLPEFEDAVARLGPESRRFRTGIAVESRYDLALDSSGTLAGTVEFRLAADAWLPGQVSLGPVRAGRCTVRTQDGTGQAAVFCLADGSVAVKTPGPATYLCDIRLPRVAIDTLLPLPLVAALSTTVQLELPEAVRPIVAGPAAAAAIVTPPAAGSARWQIVCGPLGSATVLPIVLDDGRRGSPPVRAWNAVTIQGRQAKILTRLEPAAPWTPEPLELATVRGMRITAVTAGPDRSSLPWRMDKGRLVVEIPGWLTGSTVAVLVDGVAPMAAAEAAVVPLFEPSSARWSGCNTRLAVDPSLAVQRVRLSQCLAVPAGVAAAWPLPDSEPPAAAAGIEPARLFLEHESPGGEARVVIAPREASVETARVTTVDISPGTVLGRAAVEIQVTAGQVFVLTADVAPGWFVDAVEEVDWAAGREAAELGVPGGQPPEWRVVRSPRGSELRIGLPVAATPSRAVGLRISGHRSGLPLGGEFSSDDLDMVRFPGETAVLEFQLGPTAVLESAGGGLGLEPVPDRLAPLVALAAPRARIRAGERAPAVRARVLRRRPPVEADVAIDLVARDDRLAESYTFTCRPVAGELDAVVVHFSEPMGPGLDWSLASADGGSLAAQPLAAGDALRGELRGEQAVAESWLVELRPATTAAVTFRAARTVPLAAAAVVPLAWVEAAEQPGGRVSVGGEPGRRPTAVNHRLREVPPSADAQPGVLELAYGPPRTVAGEGPALEVASPPTAAAARAWAWRQTTTCWCYESGGLEWEASFDIENQGRESATLTLPAGLRADGVTVGGEAVPAAPLGPEISGLQVPLPRAGGRIQLVVRGRGGRDNWLGWWRVGGVAFGIDMPVLEPEVRLMLPPGLVLVSPSAAASRDAPLGRLFEASIDRPAAGSESHQGFRTVVMPDSSAASVEPIVIRRQLVASLAIVAGCVSGLVAAAVVRRSGVAAIAACGVVAAAAIWAAGPWDVLARAALWGGITGTWAAGCRRSSVDRALALAWAACLLAPASAAAEAEGTPLRVYVTPGDGGGTALVPETLFRRLADAAAATGPPTVRVLATDVAADVAGGPWRIRLELDADRGGGLVLDQGKTGGSWRLPAATVRDVMVAAGPDARTVRVAAAAAGRYRLDLEVMPEAARLGDLETRTTVVPRAPQARLRLVDSERAGGWQCDREVGEGIWLPAESAAGAFDLAGASRVRLVRAADPRLSVLPAVRTAVSFNDINWSDEGCLVTATFDVGGEREIVRSLLIRAAAPLEPVRGDEPPPVSLGGGRFFLGLPEPRAGQRRIVVRFRMPLPDPVGIFDAPSVWLDEAETDLRTVRLRPAADLEVSPDLPAGLSLVRPRAEDGADTTAVWRSDAIAAAVEGGAMTAARARIVVRRRGQTGKAAQDLAVEFADDHVGLRLRCRIDTGTEPLLELPVTVPPAAIIDGIVLTRESGENGSGFSRRVDLAWSREAADRIVAVVQRPETGRFRLQLDARMPIRPARRGRLPIARLAADAMPLEVTCRATDGMGVRLESSPSTPLATGDRIELPPGERAPAYRLSRLVPEPDAGEPAAPVDSTERAALTATTIDMAVDSLGRAWALARFDLITREPVVTLLLPDGLRLFDVRVDGREITAVPGSGNAWDLRLHDVDWPRSLVAVLAGTLGGRLADGVAIRLEPPRLKGLPAGEVLWSLATPETFTVRVSEPARVLGSQEFAARLEATREAVDEAFRGAMRRAGGPLQDDLEVFAAARRNGAWPPGERSWYEAWRGAAGDQARRTLIAPDPDGSLTIRAVPAAASGSIRGLMTVALLGLVFLAWTLARTLPVVSRTLATGIRRWWWLACGCVWLLASNAPLPGLLMAVAGAWLAWPRRAPASPAAGEAETGSDSTLSFAPE